MSIPIASIGVAAELVAQVQFNILRNGGWIRNIETLSTFPNGN